MWFHFRSLKELFFECHSRRVYIRMKKKIKSLIARIKCMPYFGGIIRFLVPIVKRINRLYYLGSAENRLELKKCFSSQSDSLEERLNFIALSYGAAISGLEKASRRQEDLIDRLNEKIDQLLVEKVEIQRNFENLFKNLLIKIIENLDQLSEIHYFDVHTVQPRFLNLDKYRAAQKIKLNLGCGLNPLADYLNVERHELPGVDLIADFVALPFETQTVHVIRVANFIEFCSEKSLREKVFPYLRDLLVCDGELRLVIPDFMGLIEGYSRGEITFHKLQSVLTKYREVKGSAELIMAKPDIFLSLLKSVGFNDCKVAESRRCDGLFEFEILARK